MGYYPTESFWNYAFWSEAAVVDKTLAGQGLSFIVIIAGAQVCLKVFPGFRQIVLGLGRQHKTQFPKSRPAYCVKFTQNARMELLHCLAW
jgi:hypothetical protein